MADCKSILFVIPYTELGGAERQAFLLADGLRYKHQCHINFICFGFGEGRLTELLSEHKISYTIIDTGIRKNRILFCIKFLIHLPVFIYSVRKIKPDVIMPYTFFANIYTGILRKILNVPLCVWNQRDEGLHAKAKIGKWWNMYAVKNTDLFISNSQGGATFLESFAPLNKIKVISNGIEIATPLLHREEWRKKNGYSQDLFLVCMVSNLHINKDHETLLRAWEIVEKRCKNTYLLLAGRDNGTQSALKQLADDLKIEDTISFLGKVEDVNSLLNAIDLSILSSYSEGMSNAILESMAAELPVIGSDIPSIRFLLEKEECLFPCGNYMELANRIVDMINSSDLRTVLKTENKRKIEECFSVTKMIDSYYNEMN
jgi:glycosyltransferase involved in cell wall biosynthesis